MLKIPIETVIAKISEKTGLDQASINSAIDEKVQQLSGLVSREGAAHILANQHGVRLFDSSSRLQIKNIIPGMRNVETIGRVIRIFELKEFDSSGRKGQVASIIIGDETASIRIVLWNEQAKKAAELKEGDVVKITGGYVRDRNTTPEVHLNDRSKIAITSEEIKAMMPKGKKISELEENDSFVEIVGTLIHLFDLRFFEVCYCGRRARLQDSGYNCDVHGEVKPSYAYLLNALADDGSGEISVVFFRNQANKLLDKSYDEILAMREQADLFDVLRTQLLGRQFKIIGRVNRNMISERLEFVAQMFSSEEKDDKPAANNEYEDDLLIAADEQRGE